MEKGKNIRWFNGRGYAVLLGLVALILAYLLGSASLNSGSWWEYLGTLILIIIAFNRFVVAIKNG